MITQQLELFELFAHQKEARDFIFKKGGSGALFHEIGCGKTRTALEIFKSIREVNPAVRMIVFCPLSLVEGAWGEDIKKFTDFKYTNLRESKDGKADIFIANYEWMHSEDNQALIRSICGKVPTLCVLDESSRIKNYQAKTTKILLSHRKFFTYRIIMSGTPAPNGEVEYWAQMNFVQPGTFFESFYKFRNFYFHLARGSQKIMHGQFLSREAAREMFSKGFEYDITPAKKKDLFARITPLCHFAKKEDCLDLPDQVDEFRTIELNPQHRKIYNQMKNELIVEIGGKDIVAQVALAKIMKLRQITSGFGITPDHQCAPIEPNPKKKELQAVLEEAGGRQSIIWCQFHYEIAMIKEMLGDKAVMLYGETNDKESSIENFKSGAAQYLIAHPRSAGHGLTFVNASLQIFYSLDFSWECYEQARGRTHRAGQTNKCTYIHLIAKNSIDEHILKVLKEKGDAAEILQCLS